MKRLFFLSIAAALALPACAPAAPRTPASDAEVLERVPARAFDARTRELDALRAAWRADPRDAERAVRYARRAFDEAAAQGDPRFVGHAQAALAPWWNEAAPPGAVRVQRALVLQYGHRFDEALADLDAALADDPEDGEAWAWSAAIRMVRADYALSRRACAGLAPLAEALIGTACIAYVDSMTGRAEAASAALRAALKDARDASPGQHLWALTRLAEIDERRGAFAAAEASYRAALAQDEPDVYLLSAWADFLVDRGRPAEVLALIDARRERLRADVLLLRAALAARAASDARAVLWANELEARFAAARARGDTTHQKEESRFALALRRDAPRALALARENWALQREAADARVLLEAALAARSRTSASPVLQWLDANRVESVALRALAERVKALP